MDALEDTLTDSEEDEDETTTTTTTCPTFRPYGSISKRAASFRKLASTHTWVATEKLHGTNLAVVLRGGGTMEFARRNGMLKPGECHFGHSTVNWEPVRALYPAVVASRGADEGATVTVYGELYGGHWPGVDPGPKKPVQLNLWYRPDIAFRVFDIALGSQFLDFEVVCDLCDAAGVPRVTIAGPSGPLPEVLAWAQAHASDDVVPPAELGLPPIAPGKNPGEGWVLRTTREARLESGGRALVKVKNPAFDIDIGKSKARRTKEDRVPSKPKPKPEVPGLRYVTSARAGSVMGKMAQETAPNLASLAQALLADVIGDALEDGISIPDPPPKALLQHCFAVMRKHIDTRETM